MTTSTTSARQRMPFHPPLVHIPIGAVFTAGVLDAFSAAAGRGHGSAHDLYQAATWVLMIGMGVMFAAALAGLADRRRVVRRGAAASRTVNRHAGIMGGVMVLTIADLTLRRQHYPDAAATPATVLVVEAITVVLMVLGLHAGGKLVHGQGQNPDSQAAAASALAGAAEGPTAR